MSGFLEKENLPTITIAIVSHGADLINEKLNNIDSNVRLYSRAGQALCFGVVGINQLRFVEELYMTEERETGEDKRSSYEMLEAVAQHYKIPENDYQFVKTVTDIKETKPRPAKHTLETIEKKGHSQIYTPFYDHLYDFTDNTGPFRNNNKIYVLETKNHTSRSNINYNALPNLAQERYAIHYAMPWVRVMTEKGRFINFFKKFNLPPISESELDEVEERNLKKVKKIYADKPSELLNQTNMLLTKAKLKRYVENIYDNRYTIFKDGFVSEFGLLSQFEKPDSTLYTYIKDNDDKEIIKKTINEIKLLKSDDEILRSEKLSKRRNFYNDDAIISSIKLSDIIAFLKSEGFVIINIIDFSCRTVNDEVTKDRIKILNEQQLMIADEIDKTRGGTRRKRKRRKKRRKTRRRA
jgi:hypothetical protein